jgi:hypothetical protein
MFIDIHDPYMNTSAVQLKKNRPIALTAQLDGQNY